MIPGFLSFPPFFSVITTYPHLNSCCSMNRVRLCSQQRDGLWGEKDTRRFETHPCPGQPKHLCGIGFSAVRQIYVRFQQNKGCTESAHIPQTYLLLFYPPLTPPLDSWQKKAALCCVGKGEPWQVLEVGNHQVPIQHSRKG